MRPLRRVLVAPGVLDAFVSHARENLPLEACGFWIGRGDHAARFEPAANALRSATAYEIDPQHLFRLFRELRLSGEDLVAICHSHPKGPAQPSPRDIAEAHYPDCAYVIVSFAGAEPVVRAHQIRGGEVFEVELHAIV